MAGSIGSVGDHRHTGFLGAQGWANGDRSVAATCLGKSFGVGSPLVENV